MVAEDRGRHEEDIIKERGPAASRIHCLARCLQWRPWPGADQIQRRAQADPCDQLPLGIGEDLETGHSFQGVSHPLDPLSDML